MGLLRYGVFVLLCITSAITYAQGSTATIKLEDYKGRPVSINHVPYKLSVVHFWATWCSPCLRELPQLVKTETKLKELGLGVIYVATDNRDDVQNYLHEQDLGINALLDQYGKAMRHYKIKVLPSSVFINADGNILETHHGPIDWEGQAMRNKLQTLLSR